MKKGDAKKGDEILVTWRAIPKGIVGPWTVNYYPGEVVLTHLVKKSGGVSYGSTWWNAKGDDIKAPDNTELPTTPGETFDAPKDPPTSTRCSAKPCACRDLARDALYAAHAKGRSRSRNPLTRSPWGEVKSTSVLA